MRHRLLAAFGLGLVMGATVGACKQTTHVPELAEAQCSDMRCSPPPCCGRTCESDGGCCAGTSCSDAGRCEPPLCAACGALGCTYDASTCEGACTTPPCCLAACTGPTDCCPGTECALASSGTKKCFPTGCNTCTGMRAYCKTNGASCSVTCEAPPSCAQPCATDPECGAGSVCHAFSDPDAGSGDAGPGDAGLCVPAAFDTLCGACPQGCTFDPLGCDVACVEDAGVDAGVDGGGDGGPDAGADAGRSDAGKCMACCTPCSPVADAGLGCCAGSACLSERDGGPFRCLPAACATCPAGCEYSCPGAN